MAGGPSASGGRPARVVTLWFRLAFRNLVRHRRRTALQAAAAGGAVFLAVAFNNIAAGVWGDMIDQGTRAGSGHVAIYRRGYRTERDASMTFAAGSLVEDVKRRPGVTGVWARAYVPGLARSAREARGAVAVGMDFSSETSDHPFFRRGPSSGRWPGRPGDALLGAGLARELGLAVGDKGVWMAQDPSGDIASRRFVVSGLLATGLREVDDSTLFVLLGDLADHTGGPAHAHEIAVRWRDAQDIDAAVAAVSATLGDPALEAVDWRRAMPGLADLVRLDRAGHAVLMGSLFVIVGLGAINTLLMSVLERRREFGLLRALGARRGGVLAMVVSEGTFLALGSAAAGLGLAALAGLYTGRRGIDLSRWVGSQEAGGVLMDPVYRSVWDGGGAVVLAALMVLIGGLAALYPAARAVRTRPAEALGR